MNRRNVYLAIDADNLLCAVAKGYQADFTALLRLAWQLGSVAEAAVYGSRSYGPEHDRALLLDLKLSGFTRLVRRPLRQRPGGNPKSDIDVALALDAWDAVLKQRADTLILVSGDSDFIPLVERLTQAGVEVYVIGPDGATAPELEIVATQFCDASQVEGLLREQIIELALPERAQAA